ncbi:hypothetical protein HYH03_010378 [Edaphochlamys debaryana]|uniref:tRNA-guanine(15) transglycosylase-like domain-containing protein n=1 Tax=Edaphochlamys debaryana TaxID=47281 RepID=A0A835Y243_9CHLO|nr:hypothetical protein HYH03_010378 [Edaphochlamys debaryana]|eukprot:KAG2491165.1 hypothetical protein HYH03_010378 [Edaphochlamys debaryana]
MLLYTRRGAPLSLTPDLLTTIAPPVQGVQVDVMQFMENPDPRVLREHGGGAHGFLALGEGSVVVASNRDPSMYEYGARPSTDKEVYVQIHSGGHTVSPQRYMEAVAALRPDLYVTMCDEVTADAKPKRVATSVRRTAAWLATCLEAHAVHQGTALLKQQLQADVDALRPRDRAQSQKKAKKVSRRNEPGQGQGHGREQGKGRGREPMVQDAAAEEARTAEPEPQSAADGAAAAAEAGRGKEEAGPGPGPGAVGEEVDELEGAGEGPLAGSLLLAPLAGGGLAAERAKAAAAVGARPEIGGYALCGLGTGEAPEARPGLIAASLDALPPSALDLRPVFGPGLGGSPEEVLAAVEAGVDLIDSSYVAQLTAAGCALTFPLQPPPDWQPAAAEAGAAEGAQPGVPADPVTSADDTKINLWSPVYRLDKGPLLPGCACFACARHSRAYVHHLLNAHEMTADVLLEAHNTAHMQGFMQAVREAIAGGRLARYRAWIASRRSVPLAALPRKLVAKRRASGPAGAGAEEDEGGASEASEASDAEAGVGGDADRVGQQGQAPAKWVRV